MPLKLVFKCDLILKTLFKYDLQVGEYGPYITIYFQDMLGKKHLDELLGHQTVLLKEIRTLDSEMQVCFQVVKHTKLPCPEKSSNNSFR